MKKAAAALAALAVLALAVVLLIPAFSATSGDANYDEKAYEKAVDLKILGLLDSPDGKFDLESVPTRLEGAVMLVRLLGMEKAAEQSGYSHPFKDVPSWADAYIGYMYRNKLDTGTGDGRFGSDEPLSAVQYTVFVLRALGYDDGNNDFKYREALEKALEVGLLPPDAVASLKSKKNFLRGDMIGISYNALNVEIKASGKTLLDKLVFEDKSVYGPAATALRLYTSDLKKELGSIGSYSPASTSLGFMAKDSTDLFMIVRKFFYANQPQFDIDISHYQGQDVLKDFEQACDRANNAVGQATGVKNHISGWKYVADGPRTKISVTASYRITKNEFDAKEKKVKDAIGKARTIVAGLISNDMQAFDKEKLLHDYIVNNARYDIQNYNAGKPTEDDYTAYGCLVNGVAVCEGYAEAMKLLSDLSAVECLTISGQAYNGSSWEGHEWNLVRLDGEWYHLDVTFDDPVMEGGENILTYGYFNLTDSEAGIKSSWKKPDYPVCGSVEYGYYYRNNLIAGTPGELAGKIKEAAEKRPSVIEVKVKNYSPDGYKDLWKIVTQSGSISKFECVTNEELGVIHIYNIKYL